jgi:hypothetical protein
MSWASSVLIFLQMTKMLCLYEKYDVVGQVDNSASHDFWAD